MAGNTDIRKGFDGLAAMVKTTQSESPLRGQVIIFLGLCGDLKRSL